MVNSLKHGAESLYVGIRSIAPDYICIPNSHAFCPGVFTLPPLTDLERIER